MKKLLFFLVLFFASTTLAQQAKVLVCAPGNITAAKSTDSVLAKFYADPIDVSDTITEEINNYAAVFLIIPGHQPTFAEGKFLLNYLRSNNRLYIEYGYGTFSPDHSDTSGFWKTIGIKGANILSASYSIQHVIGVKGTFADGIYIIRKRNPEPDVPSILSVLGDETTVLYADDSIGGLRLAYKYETDSFKIVLHWATTPWATTPDWYEDFLHRVICNYFSLCAPESVRQHAENTAVEISLFPNPVRDVLHILDNANTELQSAELYSEAGSLISKISFNPNANLFDLDLGKLNLTSGNYLLHIETPKGNFSKKVLLFK